MASSGSRLESSWATRCGFSGSAFMERAVLADAPPLLDLLLDVAPPRAVVLAPQQRHEGPERLARVADQLNVHRIAKADAVRPSISI